MGKDELKRYRECPKCRTKNAVFLERCEWCSEKINDVEIIENTAIGSNQPYGKHWDGSQFCSFLKWLSYVFLGFGIIVGIYIFLNYAVIEVPFGTNGLSIFGIVSGLSAVLSGILFYSILNGIKRTLEMLHKMSD